MLLLLAACGRLEIGAYSELSGDDHAGDSAGRRGLDSNAGASSSEGGMSGARAVTDAGSPSAGDSAGAGEGGVWGDGGAAGDEGAADSASGAAGVGGRETDIENTTDRSCRGIEDQCRDYLTCCAPSYVQSEDFVLGWDEFAVDAHVSLFYPDALEVTVGRFANFVEDFENWLAAGHPKQGAGEHLLIAGTGWKEEWPLPVSRAGLEHVVSTCTVSTYDERETEPELPMNCVNWYEAFAFCIWDGKRLLTEAEWEMVAKGGAEDRTYPWGDSPEPTPDHAVYGYLADGSPEASPFDVLPVGSRPLGTSRDGSRDMAGSVAEWVFDRLSNHYENPCDDCANLENETYPNHRIFRGGGYSDHPALLRTERRNYMDSSQRLNFVGFRCARSVFEY
jgi:formylglycine-generating enzyme